MVSNTTPSPPVCGWNPGTEKPLIGGHTHTAGGATEIPTCSF